MLGMGRSAALKKAAAAVGFLAVVTTAGGVFGQPPGGGHPPSPPPEALEACQGKSPGETVTLQSPHGHRISGTCREMADGRLAAVPEGGPQGRRPGPPPDAFQACEGKRQGDTVQIQTPEGGVVTATCLLVAVPQR